MTILQNGALDRMFPITEAYKPYDFFLAPQSRNRVFASHNMPLVHNTVYSYMIRNDLTHTVLEFAYLIGDNVLGTPTLPPLACSTMLTRASLAIGWGWHGEKNQKVGDEVLSSGTHADALCLHSGNSSETASRLSTSGSSRTSEIRVASFVRSMLTIALLAVAPMPMRLSSSSGSRGPLKGTGTESQLSVRDIEC